jgi:hypothetical protein
MLSKIPERFLESLTVRDLEELLERKKKNSQLRDLLRERDRLRLEIRRIDDQIEAIERNQRESEEGAQRDGSTQAEALAGVSPAGFSAEGAEAADAPVSFLAGKRRKNLKDYIAQVLLEAQKPMSPAEIQKRLPEVGYVSNSTNPRSFYNTVFQALQRYDIFEKDSKKYRLSDEAFKANGVREILPKKKTRLKDYIIEVLDKSDQPLKVSEIASRVVIAGYDTDLEMDELNQRVSATLKKYLNKDFDWDSQRYRLANRNN